MGEPSSPRFLQDRAALYDCLIDWPKRLASETPFYRKLFEEAGVRRVLDAACGTGRHAAMFHSWGLEVEGADLSEDMIRVCRERVGEPSGLRWVVRSFDQPASSVFDAVVCAGNSLALASDLAGMERALAAMIGALRAGGVCIVQVLNLWSIEEGPTVWQKHLRTTFAGGDHILLKGIHRAGSRGFVDFVDLELLESGLTPRFDRACFLGIEEYELTEMAEQAGAEEIRVFGSVQFAPYARQNIFHPFPEALHWYSRPL